MRRRQIVGQRRTLRQGQRGEALLLGPGAAVRIRPGIGQKPEACLAAKADALGYAGEQGQQCRLEGARQHDGAIVAVGAEPPRQATPRRQREPAMRHRELEAVGDLGHEIEQRAGGRRRHGIELQARRAAMQQLEQGMGDHHVADPGGTDDQDFHRRSSGRATLFVAATIVRFEKIFTLF